MNINQTGSQYQRIHLQPAYILHTKDFQNTSLLIDVFTLNHGRIRVVAKGAKRLKSAFSGKLQLFAPLLISWSGKSDLYTLTDVDSTNAQNSSYLNGQLHLRGASLLSAYYINELILRFMTLEDPHPELFYYYVDALEKLILKQNVESVLRVFEKWLLHESGYSLVLTHDTQSGEAVDENSNYHYLVDDGPVLVQQQDTVASNGLFVVAGSTLLDLERGIFRDAESLKQAKQLMRIIISGHLGDKPLKTRTLFQSTIL